MDERLGFKKNRHGLMDEGQVKGRIQDWRYCPWEPSRRFRKDKEDEVKCDCRLEECGGGVHVVGESPSFEEDRFFNICVIEARKMQAVVETRWKRGTARRKASYIGR